MAATIKGINVEIGGDTTGLTNALKNVNSTTKNTQSELNAVNRLLKLDPSNITLLTQKSELLSEQINNVKGKLKTLESVQAQVEKQFQNGDIGVEQYRAFERELESTKGHLSKLVEQSSNTSNKLSSTGNNAKDCGKDISLMGKDAKNSKSQFDSLKTSASELASKGFSAIKNAAKTAVVGIGAAVGGLAATGTAITSAASSTAKAGDEIDKQSQKLNVSAKQYQQLSYAANLCGTNMSTLKTASKNLQSSGSKLDLTQALKQVASISDESQRSAKAVELFGSKAALELKPMLNQGAKGIDTMLNSASALGLVMSNDSVKAAAKYQDSLTSLKSTMSAVKNGIVSNLLPGLTTVMDGVTGLFTGDSGAVGKIKDGLNSMVQSIKQIAPRFSSIIKTIGDAIVEVLPTVIQTILTTLSSLDIGNTIIKPIGQALINALPLIMDAVLSILNSLIDILVEPSTISSIVSSVLSLINTLAESIITALPKLVSVIAKSLPKLISDLSNQLVNLLPMLVSGFTNIVLSLLDSLPQIIQSLIVALPLVITSIISALTQNIPLIIDGLVSMLTTLIDNLPTIIAPLIDALPQIVNSIITTLLSMLPQLIDAGITLLVSLVDALPQIIEQIVSVLPQLIDGIITAILSAIPQLIQAGIKLLLALIDALPQIILTIVNSLPQIIDGIINGLLKALPQLIECGIELFVSLIENLPKIIIGIVTHIPQIIEGIIKAFGSLFGKMAEVGGNMLSGLWKGICDGAQWLWDKISGFCQGIWDGICGFFGIHSPSKLFRDDLGKNLMLGWKIGIDKNSDEVTNAIGDISDKVVNVSYSSIDDLDSSLENLNGFKYSAQRLEKSSAQGESVSNISNVNNTPITINFGDVSIRNDNDIDTLANRISEVLANQKITKTMAWG